VIGDNCYFGAGAAVIGAVRIGNKCRIGANCTVCADIPDNSVVVSQPPRILQRQDINNKYYKWSEDGPVYYENGKWYLEENPQIIDN